MLTPLAVAALALLAERPMHPYEMYQLMLHRRDDRLVKVRPGSLYHTIDRLARAGLADVVGTEREGNRPERTTYRVSAAGRDALRERLIGMLSSRAGEYPEFPLALSQAHHLPAQDATALLAARIDGLRASLAELDSGVEHVTSLSIAEKYWIDVDYQRAMLHAELAWLEQLLERIASGRLDW